MILPCHVHLVSLESRVDYIMQIDFNIDVIRNLITFSKVKSNCCNLKDCIYSHYCNNYKLVWIFKMCFIKTFNLSWMTSNWYRFLVLLGGLGTGETLHRKVATLDSVPCRNVQSLNSRFKILCACALLYTAKAHTYTL